MYTIKYKSGKQQGNVDTLSRFPLLDNPTSSLAETVVLIEHLSTIPLTTSKIAKQTELDPILYLVESEMLHKVGMALNSRLLTNSGYNQMLTQTNLIKRLLNADTPPESGIHLYILT